MKKNRRGTPAQIAVHRTFRYRAFRSAIKSVAIFSIFFDSSASPEDRSRGAWNVSTRSNPCRPRRAFALP